MDEEWVTQKLLRMEWWIGTPCHLACITCSWDFRGGGQVPSWVDAYWIDPSRWGQVSAAGAVKQSHPKHYGVSQFLGAIQSGLHIITLGALGIPHLAIFSGSNPPLPKWWGHLQSVGFWSLQSVVLLSGRCSLGRDNMIVWHICKFRNFRWIQEMWCFIRIRSIWPTLYLWTIAWTWYILWTQCV